MLWKDFACENCGKIQENVPSKPEDTERGCPCGGTAKIILYPKPTRFRGSGWTTRRPIETFDNEPDNPEDWGPESHGLSGIKK